jgi:hypothetical protein
MPRIEYRELLFFMLCMGTKHGAISWKNMGERISRTGCWARIIEPNGDEVTGHWKALYNEDLHNLNLRSNMVRIVTCRPISRKRVVKHVSAEIRFLETNHCWVLNKGFLGYKNERCRFLETNKSLWSQQEFPSK